MAIIKSLAVRNARKKLAGMVYYKRGDQDLVREQAASVSNPRTVAQMDQRVKWANLVAFYKANKGWMNAHAFEFKKATQSDYNKFMSINLANNPVYLSKTQASNGCVIAAPYIISQGSLSPVQVDAQGVTGLNLEVNITNESTIGEFSTAFLAKNKTWAEGDQLSFIICAGYNTDDVPMLQVAYAELIINTQDTNLMRSNLLGALIDKNGDNKLAIDLDLSDFVSEHDCVAIACIHSRTVSGMTSVSTETLALDTDAQALLALFTGADVKRRARNSYGLNRQYFLDAGIENEGGQESNVQITNVLIEGSEFNQATNIPEDSPVFIIFNQTYAANANTTVEAVDNQSNATVIANGAQVADNQNTWSFDSHATNLEGIVKIRVKGTADDASAVVAEFEAGS